MPDLGRVAHAGLRHVAEEGGGPAAWRALRLFTRARREGADAVLVNTDAACLLALCAWAFWIPSLRIIGCDTVLGRPRGALARLLLPLKRALLGRVDRFLFPFRDLSGVQEVYGLHASKCEYLPFKSNAWERATPNPEGDYVLAAGRSMRDFETLRRALEGFPGEARLLLPGATDQRAHGALGFGGPLPTCLRVESDDGSADSWRRHLARARIVVVPVRADTIVASGISTCLDAMAYGKCVVVTDSPATRGILDDGTAYVVPARDPAALRRALTEAWNSPELRARYGAAGRRRAEACQGTERYVRSILDACARLPFA